MMFPPFLALIAWAASAAAAPPALEIETSNGLVLGIAPNGSISSLRAGGGNVLTAGNSSGFWVRDIQTGEAEQLLGHAEPAVGGVVITGRAPRLRLKARAELVRQRGAVRIRGWLEDETGRERAADLQVRLYCDARGAQWVRDTWISEPIAEKAPEPRTVFPLHSLTLPGKGAFALAVAAEEPAIFEFVYQDRAWLGLTLKYGLSQFASGALRGRANFDLFLYAIDPQWGFRSAVENYYRLEERWFARRANRDGMWLHNYHSEMVPNPWDYAYRVEVKGAKGNDPGYKGPGWEKDARQGLPTLEYLISGMRELVRLPQVPKTYAEQMRVLEGTAQPYTHNIAPDSVYSHPKLERDVIRNSGMFDGEGHYRILPRDTFWGGPSLTFPLNTSPHLFDDLPLPTVGKITMEWVRWLIRDTPFIQGVFVDSLYGWGRYFNCRSEHFPYARVSLTYDPESRKPAIANMFANQESLLALREELHPQGRLVMGNGLRAGRFFNGMALDVLGTESPVMPRRETDIMGAAGPGGGPKIPIGLTEGRYQNLIYYRIVAGQKPHLIMNFEKKEWADMAILERFWKIGLFLGIYPGYRQVFGDGGWEYDAKQWAAVQKIVNHYSPLLKQITAAGWQPIPHARTGNADVWIERWGTAPPALFFTLMNTGRAPQKVSVAIDRNALGLEAPLHSMELVRLDAPVKVEGDRVECALEPGEVRLLRVGR